ncbi:hypothetical protein [Flagellimonas meridianipacifica]|uniref:Uncharacterized protein n=1 Tax=Flagellimonas meridianipacifica TaxID=1080225 RepID=A0A2T0M939_9FLAO|nr:hypothetical protein [Allomuricauda pacifica]PRX53942.1 hypothetical protein CLV81_2335 [Allomuricauda pacifica]
MRKRNYIIFVLGICFLATTENSHAQFLKKLKKKTEAELLQKTEEVAGKVLGDDKKNEQKENTKSEPKDSTQSSSKGEGPITVQDPGILTYDSPNPLFRDISVQHYKGIPRFGSCDFYFKSPNRPDGSPEGKAKRKLMEAGYTGFMQLVQINLLNDLFKSIDKEALTPRPKTLNEEEIKSHKAQQMLANFVFAVGSESLQQQYFCNPEENSGNCRVVNTWGGFRADDFTENEKYVDFVDKHLDPILEWSKSFFSDGTQTVYLVWQLKDLGTYDFERNGFWISLPHKIRNGRGFDYNSTRESYFFTFLPKTDYGQQVLSKTNQVEYIKGKVLFKIEPDKAEKLINDRYKDLQIVSKVKIVFEGLEEANRFSFTPTYSYHFQDPIVEIFEDIQLTQKLGSLDMRQLVYKEN